MQKGGKLGPKLQVQGVSPPIIFTRIVRPINALQLCHWQFLQKEFLQAKCDFRRK